MSDDTVARQGRPSVTALVPQPGRRSRARSHSRMVEGQQVESQLSVQPKTSRHPVDEVLPPGRMATVALQHVAGMYAGGRGRQLGRIAAGDRRRALPMAAQIA
ncbi:hypothetical protein ACGFMM_10725 [Streptomyces sp. NPDC048604]|uniref:hypothetical protein n=1 Tax=Streptomyces sp. NPDC048604 TaxID=3365578 RepID=UPI003721381C